MEKGQEMRNIHAISHGLGDLSHHGFLQEHAEAIDALLGEIM